MNSYPLKIAASIAIALAVGTGLAPRATADSLTDGLVLYYSFDSNGNAIVPDNSGKGHTGAVHGAIWTNDAVRGGAYYLNGTGYISTPHADDLNANTGITVAVWINIPANNTDTYRGIVSKQSDPDWWYNYAGWSLTAVDTNMLEMSFKGNAGPQGGFNDATLNYRDGQWHHVVGTWGQSNPTLYVDGTAVPSSRSQALASCPDSLSELRIGDYAFASFRRLRGKVDDVRIYSRVLGASEVSTLFLATGGDTTTTSTTSTTTTSSTSTTGAALTLTDGLVLLYAFDADGNTSVPDGSGKNHTGAFHGAVWTNDDVRGGVCDLDGSSYISTPNVDDLNANTGITVAAWVNIPADFTASYVGIVSKQSATDWWNGHRGWSLLNPETNTLALNINGDNGGNGATENIRDGEWHHFVGTWASGYPRLFLDGAEVPIDLQPVFAASCPDTTSELRIGDYAYGIQPRLRGRVDDVRIYSRALGASEVSTLFLTTGGATTTTSTTSSTSTTSTTTTSSTSTTATLLTLNDGLVLHYTFDTNGSGVVTDTSGNGHTGVQHGAQWTADGTDGGACQFNAGEDYLETDDINALDGVPQYSFAAWVQFDQNRRQALFSKDSQAVRGYGVGYDPTLGFSSGMNGVPFGDSAYAKTGESLQAGQWYHVVLAYDGSLPNAQRIQYYVDGVSTSTVTVGTLPVTTPETALTVVFGGRSDTPGQHLGGKLDDVRLYNRALTATDAQALYVMAAANATTKSSTTTTTTTSSSSSTSSSTTSSTTTTSTTTLPHAQPDFDGDRAADLGTFNAKTGDWDIRNSSDGKRFSGGLVNWGPTTRCFPEDYDGDGLADFAGYAQVDAKWYILQSSDGQMLGGGAITWGPGGGIPIPQDYDGDGRCDLAVYKKSDGTWTIRASSNGQMLSGAPIIWGPHAIPVPADYDGDGIADLAVYVEASHAWLIRQSHDGQMLGGSAQVWGSANDVPVPGDYDGDRKADLAVYNSKSGKWSVRLSTSGKMLDGAPIAWGAAVAVPVPNDYDGDGRTDLGVYVFKTGKWYVRQSSDGKLMGGGDSAQDGISWGRSTVTPASSMYQTLRLMGLVP